MFDELDALTEKRETIVKAPFSYPGGKSRSVKEILPRLPVRKVWCEVFGGSGVITLNRPKSKIEIFNDRHSGVTDFYRCLRSRELLDALCKWCDTTVHSREEFLRCRDTWHDVNDPIERAGRWLYMVNYSFGSLGRNFGRATTGDGTIAGKLRSGVSAFRDLHARLMNVQIENADWSRILRDYDSPETVFYLDPPYVDAYRGTYEYEMTIDQHRDLIRSVFNCKGFVAVSGYPNPLYDGQPWTTRYDWDIQSTAKALAFQEENNKTHQDTDRGRVIECLWIKEAQ